MPFRQFFVFFYENKRRNGDFSYYIMKKYHFGKFFHIFLGNMPKRHFFMMDPDWIRIRSDLFGLHFFGPIGLQIMKFTIRSGLNPNPIRRFKSDQIFCGTLYAIHPHQKETKEKKHKNF